MRPRFITIKVILFAICTLASFAAIVAVLQIHDLSPISRYSLCALFCLIALFCVYKIYCLFHRKSVFHKGLYHVTDLDGIDGIDFEQIVCDILVENGFELAESTQASADFGVDVLALREGISYAIQCKRYDGPVGLEAVQQVYAGRAYYECHVALVLTNQYFTSGAKKLADKIGVVLWDRDTLEQLL